MAAFLNFKYRVFCDLNASTEATAVVTHCAMIRCMPLQSVAKITRICSNMLKYAEVIFSCFHVFTEPEALQCQVETPLFVAFNGDHFALLLGNARRPRQWMQSMACIDTQ